MFFFFNYHINSLVTNRTVFSMPSFFRKGHIVNGNLRFKCKNTRPKHFFFHMCAPHLVSEEYIHTWRYPSAFLVLHSVLLLLGFGLGPFWWIFIFASRNQLPRWLPHFFHVVSMFDQLDQLPSTPTFHGIFFAPFHVVLFDARHVYLQYIPLESRVSDESLSLESCYATIHELLNIVGCKFKFPNQWMEVHIE